MRHQGSCPKNDLVLAACGAAAAASTLLGALLSPVSALAALETGSKASHPELSTEASTEDADDRSVIERFSLNYTNIFYGPALQNASSYQPDPYGKPDQNRPIYMKNFLNLSYGITPEIAVTGSFYWQYRPVLGQELLVQDPFLRISHSQIFYTDWGLNLYSDARVHFGVTDASRQNDMITGFQNFSYLSWNIAQSRASLALRASARYNVYGNQGEGVDAEFYLAPEATYQLTSNFALTLLYEMGASHRFGDSATYFTNDGTDLEPGFSWDITPGLNVNPYLNLFPGGKMSLASTSVGMFLSWNMF
jgi:hypothetical protein